MSARRTKLSPRSFSRTAGTPEPGWIFRDLDDCHAAHLGLGGIPPNRGRSRSPPLWGQCTVSASAASGGTSRAEDPLCGRWGADLHGGSHDTNTGCIEGLSHGHRAAAVAFGGGTLRTAVRKEWSGRKEWSLVKECGAKTLSPRSVGASMADTGVAGGRAGTPCAIERHPRGVLGSSTCNERLHKPPARDHVEEPFVVFAGFNHPRVAVCTPNVADAVQTPAVAWPLD